MAHADLYVGAICGDRRHCNSASRPTPPLGAHQADEIAADAAIERPGDLRRRDSALMREIRLIAHSDDDSAADQMRQTTLRLEGAPPRQCGQEIVQVGIVGRDGLSRSVVDAPNNLDAPLVN